MKTKTTLPASSARRTLLHGMLCACLLLLGLGMMAPPPDLPGDYDSKGPGTARQSGGDGPQPRIAPWPPCEAAERIPQPPFQAPRTARLLFVGDVMQHLPQVQAARQPDGSFDYTEVFADVAPYFAAADLAVANLETTLTDTDDYAGYPCFRSPIALAAALRTAGIDLCALANNHCCDAGARGIRITTKALSELGLLHTGVFADSIARATTHPLVVERNGIRFALLNYTESTNGIPTPRGTWVNRIDTAAMRTDLQRACATADCTVVIIHWGNEYQREPSREQRRLAQFLRRHGADLVVGSHPHVVQPFEVDSTGGVFYSLGNFVSNQRRRHTDGGLMARLTVVLEHDGRLHWAADAVPVWVQLPGYRILTPESAGRNLRDSTACQAYERFRQDLAPLLDIHLATHR